MGNGDRRKRDEFDAAQLTEEADTSRAFASLYTYGADSRPSYGAGIENDTIQGCWKL